LRLVFSLFWAGSASGADFALAKDASRWFGY
jgi:hypothetical protein